VYLVLLIGVYDVQCMYFLLGVPSIYGVIFYVVVLMVSIRLVQEFGY